MLYTSPMRTVLSFIFLAICALSCRKSESDKYCTRTYNCFDPGLLAYFLGYSRAEADTVFYRKFIKNSNFGLPFDLQTDTTLATFYEYRNVFFSFNLGRDYDYEIILPGANDTYRFSKIMIEDTAETISGSCRGMAQGNYVCLNNFHQDEMIVTRNGNMDMPVNIHGYEPGNGYLIELKK